MRRALFKYFAASLAAAIILTAPGVGAYRAFAQASIKPVQRSPANATGAYINPALSGAISLGGARSLSPLSADKRALVFPAFSLASGPQASAGLSLQAALAAQIPATPAVQVEALRDAPDADTLLSAAPPLAVADRQARATFAQRVVEFSREVARLPLGAASSMQFWRSRFDLSALSSGEASNAVSPDLGGYRPASALLAPALARRQDRGRVEGVLPGAPAGPPASPAHTSAAGQAFWAVVFAVPAALLAVGADVSWVGAAKFAAAAVLAAISLGYASLAARTGVAMWRSLDSPDSSTRITAFQRLWKVVIEPIATQDSEHPALELVSDSAREQIRGHEAFHRRWPRWGETGAYLSQLRGFPGHLLFELKALYGAARGLIFGDDTHVVASTEPLRVSQETLSVVMTESGKAPVTLSFPEYLEFLRRNPEHVQDLNSTGLLRVVVAQGDSEQGLQQDDAARLMGLLRSARGLTSAVQVEVLPVDWERHQQEKDSAGAGAAGSPIRQRIRTAIASAPLFLVSLGVWVAWIWGQPTLLFVGMGLFFVLEARFLARTFLASLRKPSSTEIAGGMITKMLPFFTASMWVWIYDLWGHPWLLAGALAFLFALEAFHGFFLYTWDTFNDNINKLRPGGAYQIGFGWLYGLTTAGVQRLFASLGHPGSAEVPPPWSISFLKTLFGLSLFGATFGGLGMRGLNRLYETNIINRRQRSAIQQMRDLFMIVSGPFLGTGNMWVFWIIWGIQQLVDIAIFIYSLTVKPRKVDYVMSTEVRQFPEFAAKYPVAMGPPQSPVKEAVMGLINNPFLWPITLPIKGMLLLARRFLGPA